MTSSANYSIPTTSWKLPAEGSNYVPPSLPWKTILWIGWAVLLVAGAYGVWLRLSEGHLPAGYGSYVPWGLWIGLYFHGVGMAGGAFILGALGYLLRWPGFHESRNLRLVIVLSVAAILPAFFGVWLDLGHLDRFQYIFLTPSFTSMMAFNAWMYYAFMFAAAGAWWLSFWEKSVWLRPLLCLALLFALLFPSQSGAFFGVVDAKGYWHSALLPLLFLISAITAGSALLMLARILIDASRGDKLTPVMAERREALVTRLRLVVLLGMAAYFVFEFAELSIMLWSPVSHAPAIDLMLFGPYWWVFWIVHLAIGGIVPAVLLLRRHRFGWTIAALLVAVCFLSARMNVLVPGQAVGELKGLQEAFHHDRLTYIYHATPMEYLVGLFLIALGMATFHLGFRINQALANRFAASTSQR